MLLLSKYFPVDSAAMLNNKRRIGKSTIRDESRPLIDQIVKLLTDNTNLKLSIEGHTDNVGDAKSNKTLSDQRAKNVLDALTKAGVDGKRLSAIGYGQDKPVADNRNEEGRAKNRRVELVKKQSLPHDENEAHP